MSKKFYAQKDALGFPIPGTMMSASQVPSTSIEIPSTTFSGTAQKHPGDLRYFVRRDRKGNIIPNSLIVTLDQPKGNVIEFKLPA